MTRSLKVLSGANAILLFAALACGPDVDRADGSEERVIKISGDLIRDDDSPATSAAVRLLLDGDQLSTAQADADGHFVFLVEGQQLDGAETLGVRAEVNVSGGTAEVGVNMGAGNAQDITLPALRFLEAPLSHSDSGDEVTVTIPNYAGADGQRPLGYELQVHKLSGWLLAATPASASSSVVRVHKALLEDYNTSLRLVAELDLSGGLAGFAAAPQVQLDPLNAAPLSRGASCEYASTDQQSGVALSPCPLTDGNLQTTLEPSGAICIDPDPEDAIQECASTWERVVIDLGSAQTVQVFAVHDLGAAASVLLERSDDGVAFSNVTSVTTDSFIFDTAFDARFIRMSYSGTETDSQLAGLNEIVVY